MAPRVTPHQLELWSQNLSSLYNALEGEIIRAIIRRLNSGHADITEWQAQKLSELRLFNSDVTQFVSETTKVAESQVRLMFERVGKQVVIDIDDAMPFATQALPNKLDSIMRAYGNQGWSDINNHVNQTLITTNYGKGIMERAYQKTLSDTAAMFNTGLYTMEQSLERAVQQLALTGIKSTFIDRGKHTWSIERYVRTVLKSTLGNTYDELRKERMADYGVHTVVVTAHPGARHQCSKIQGNVVDLRMPYDIPVDSEYESIYEPEWGAEYGEPGGHRGINCAHLHIPFIPGVSTNNQPKYDPMLNRKVAEAKNTQRRMEREIVKYKKYLMVSDELGSNAGAYWKTMISGRQGALREHINKNSEFLSRNYKREKVYTPLKTMMQDFVYDQK